MKFPYLQKHAMTLQKSMRNKKLSAKEPKKTRMVFWSAKTFFTYACCWFFVTLVVDLSKNQLNDYDSSLLNFFCVCVCFCVLFFSPSLLMNGCLGNIWWSMKQGLQPVLFRAATRPWNASYYYVLPRRLFIFNLYLYANSHLYVICSFL